MQEQGYGFIREKRDIKLLIVYCMQFIEEPLDIAHLADIVLCDDGFGYFEYVDALYDLIGSGHITVGSKNGEDVYSLTEKGHLTAEVFEKDITSPVRDAAKRAAVRVMRANHRDAAIATELITRKDGSKAVRMGFSDGTESVFEFEIMVLDEEQGNMFIRNFKGHAEQMYSRVMKVLADRYDEPDEFTKTLLTVRDARLKKNAENEEKGIPVPPEEPLPGDGESNAGSVTE